MSDASKIKEVIARMDDNLAEINNIKESLEELSLLEEKDILVPIANGIFFKAKITDKDNLKVNVGHDTVLDKTIPETLELLEVQRQEILSSKEQAVKYFEELVRKEKLSKQNI